MSITITAGPVTSEVKKVFISTIVRVYSNGPARENAIAILNAHLDNTLIAAKKINEHAQQVGIASSSTNIFLLPVESAELKKVFEQVNPTPIPTSIPTPTTAPAPGSSDLKAIKDEVEKIKVAGAKDANDIKLLQADAAQKTLDITGLKTKLTAAETKINNIIEDIGIVSNANGIQSITSQITEFKKDITISAALLVAHQEQADERFNKQNLHNAALDLIVLQNNVDNNEKFEGVDNKFIAQTALFVAHEEENKQKFEDVDNKFIVNTALLVAHQEQTDEKFNKQNLHNAVLDLIILKENVENKQKFEDVDKKFIANAALLVAHEEENKQKFEDVDKKFIVNTALLVAHEEENKQKFEDVDKKFIANTALLVAHEEENNERFRGIEQKNTQASLLFSQHVIENQEQHDALKKLIHDLGALDADQISALVSKNIARELYFSKYKGTANFCIVDENNPTSFTLGDIIAKASGTEISFKDARDACHSTATDLTKSHYLYTKDANGDPTCALLGVAEFDITCNALIKGFITFEG